LTFIFPGDTVPGLVQFNLNAEGVNLPSHPAVTKLIRYQLQIEASHTGGIFYKDSYGKYSHIKVTVGVVDKDNRVAKNINIPLTISLRYKNSDTDIVSREPILNTFGLVHTLQQGYALIPVRIEDVSSNHQNQDFAFYIGPLDAERYADVQGATSTAIHVKAKLRPLDPALTPPKFKLSTFREELAVLRGGDSHSFYDAIEAMHRSSAAHTPKVPRKKAAASSTPPAPPSPHQSQAATASSPRTPVHSSSALALGLGDNLTDDDMDQLMSHLADIGFDDRDIAEWNEEQSIKSEAWSDWGDSFLSQDV
jgi:hypothetical protein